MLYVATIKIVLLIPSRSETFSMFSPGFVECRVFLYTDWLISVSENKMSMSVKAYFAGSTALTRRFTPFSCLLQLTHVLLLCTCTHSNKSLYIIILSGTGICNRGSSLLLWKNSLTIITGIINVQVPSNSW